MIFLPNKFEKFCAALRNHTQNCILKNGIQKKHLQRLRKIHYAEAIFSRSEKPVIIAELSRFLVCACHIKRLENDEFLHFLILGDSRFIINEKAYTSLLLCLCQEASFIKIVLKKCGISIFCNSLPDCTLKLIKALNGICLYEKKKKTAGIFIPAVLTDKKVCDNLYYHSLRDELSIVNIYLS